MGIVRTEITLKNTSRCLKDFIDAETAKKAGIIEIRSGASPAIPFNSSFAWPSLPEISSLEYDSRHVEGGSLYFALPGLHSDGHDFIDEAIKRGAAAVVHEKELAAYNEKIFYMRVKNSRFAMSPIADSFNGFPSRSMVIIGVTGTEGKSTTVSLIHQLLKLLGNKAGLISTVEQGDGLVEKRTVEHQTTPEAPVCHKLLAEMLRNGAEYAVVESSSHGLSKKTNRLGDVDFDVGVMTNVAHEHLEFHGTWEQYRNDKAELFRALDSSPSSHKKRSDAIKVPSFGVFNADDKSASFFAAATKQKTYSFSTKGAKADLSLKSIDSREDGNSYEVYISSSGETISISDRLPGAFNSGNVLAALLVVSKLLSMEIKELGKFVPSFKPVWGRMTAINRGQPYEVIVDYAHTPSSFEAIFPPLRQRLNSSGGRIISVFGCPGERDTQKRKLQGEIAARYCDIIVLADEDPRGEEPMAILEEIARGIHGEKAKLNNFPPGETLFLIPNRGKAIRKAYSLARPKDLVILLGKSHENSIIYASGTIVYDEIGEAENALEELGFRN